MKKAPGRTPGLFLFDAFCRSEPVIKTGAHDIAAEVCIRSRGSGIAEIDIEIFDLGGPRPGDRRFNAAADGPAGLGRPRIADVSD